MYVKRQNQSVDERICSNSMVHRKNAQLKDARMYMSYHCVFKINNLLFLLKYILSK